MQRAAAGRAGGSQLCFVVGVKGVADMPLQTTLGFAVFPSSSAPSPFFGSLTAAIVWLHDLETLLLVPPRYPSARHGERERVVN